MTRTELLNRLIRARGFGSYLEIGVRDSTDNFDRIAVGDKHGVDPASRCSHPVTSDQFFAACDRKYDLVFVDGLHEDAQVTRDIANALDVLAPDGAIVVHDCNPPSESHQSDSFNGGAWTGTVWKAFARLRHDRANDLVAFVVDADWGLGIVTQRSSAMFDFQLPPAKPPAGAPAHLDYAYLAAHRDAVLGLVAPEEFERALVPRLAGENNRAACPQGG